MAPFKGKLTLIELNGFENFEVETRTLVSALWQYAFQKSKTSIKNHSGSPSSMDSQYVRKLAFFKGKLTEIQLNCLEHREADKTSLWNLGQIWPICFLEIYN